MLRTLWAFPATLLGLVIAVLTGAFRRGRCSIRSGVLEVHSPGIRRALRHLPGTGGFVSAMTLGHVVIGVDAQALERTRDHEGVHVRQYERWGPFFIPAYALASLWALMRGGHAYWDNPFERDAFRAELASRHQKISRRVEVRTPLEARRAGQAVAARPSACGTDRR